MTQSKETVREVKQLAIHFVPWDQFLSTSLPIHQFPSFMGTLLSQFIYNLVFAIFPKSNLKKTSTQTLTKLEVNETPFVSFLQVRTKLANVNVWEICTSKMELISVHLLTWHILKDFF